METRRVPLLVPHFDLQSIADLGPLVPPTGNRTIDRLGDGIDKAAGPLAYATGGEIDGPPPAPQPPPPPRKPGEWIDINRGLSDGTGGSGGGGGVIGGAVVLGVLGTIAGVKWLRGHIGGGGSSPKPSNPPPPSTPTPSRGPSPGPIPVAPTRRSYMAASERAEVAQLTKTAENLFDEYQKAVAANLPVVDAYNAAKAAGDKLVARLVQIMGLPPSYASRIHFQPDSIDNGWTNPDTKQAYIGWGLVTADGAGVIEAIAHEAAHLYQIDRDGLNRAKFDANRATYESEATRMAEDYMRRLGYDEATIRALRPYAVPEK
jgi:hypothetical protein